MSKRTEKKQPSRSAKAAVRTGHEQRVPPHASARRPAPLIPFPATNMESFEAAREAVVAFLSTDASAISTSRQFRAWLRHLLEAARHEIILPIPGKVPGEWKYRADIPWGFTTDQNGSQEFVGDKRSLRERPEYRHDWSAAISAVVTVAKRFQLVTRLSERDCDAAAVRLLVDDYLEALAVGVKSDQEALLLALFRSECRHEKAAHWHPLVKFDPKKGGSFRVAARALLAKGKLERRGKGTKGSPYQYRLAE